MVLQTTMKLSKKSRKEWEEYKNHPSETLENMVNRILKSVYTPEESLNAKDLEDIKLAMDDFANGRFTSHEDLKKELKL